MTDRPITTTLNRIRAHGPCKDGWEKLLTYLGKTRADDEPLPYATILKSNGLDDALWCCQAEPQYEREWRLYAVWCARQVQHLMTDQRSIDAIDIAEKYANGQATKKDLNAAWNAARAATWAAAADADADAAWEAAWAADAATTRATTRAVARSASKAATAAKKAAWKAAWAAGASAVDADNEMEAKQAAKFLEIVGDADE